MRQKNNFYQSKENLGFVVIAFSKFLRQLKKKSVGIEFRLTNLFPTQKEFLIKIVYQIDKNTIVTNKPIGVGPFQMFLFIFSFCDISYFCSYDIFQVCTTCPLHKHSVLWIFIVSV